MGRPGPNPDERRGRASIADPRRPLRPSHSLSPALPPSHDAIPSPVSTPNSSSLPPQKSQPFLLLRLGTRPPAHAAQEVRKGASDGGRLASHEDGEGRRDGSGRGHHLGHHRRHLVRRAPGGAPRRAPGPRPDAQDVRQLRGHFRRRRRALHRRGADCAEPAQEARLRQRSHRRLRLRRHRLWIQRKEH